MKYAQLFTGIAIGFASAYIFKKRKSSISSTEALHNVKQAFKQNGTVDGSWIQTTTKLTHKNGLSFEGYNGGIMRTYQEKQEHYEFFVDKDSGAIIDLTLISQS
ncbi:peptidase [Priestia megaterium]|nr:peptidase [Priestia megaterium]